ncbi:hypothetical protein STAN_7075 [Streptomyces sp. CBMAI 2042]|nr:hypothetical protein STAN_7075 [Streptomyces sp. CBMAI 2042]
MSGIAPCGGGRDRELLAGGSHSADASLVARARQPVPHRVVVHKGDDPAIDGRRRHVPLAGSRQILPAPVDQPDEHTEFSQHPDMTRHSRPGEPSSADDAVPVVDGDTAPVVHPSREILRHHQRRRTGLGMETSSHQPHRRAQPRPRRSAPGRRVQDVLCSLRDRRPPRRRVPHR